MSQAQRVIAFIETFLTLGHSYAGQPFILEDWQKAVIEDIYAEDSEGKRLRRTYVLGLPRKNGKSQLGAALALYHLIADQSDATPQVISAAGDRAQARLVFEEAQRMVRTSPDLSAVCEVFRNEIRCTLNNGTYKAVSADAGLQQGLNPSMVVMDELHVHKNADLYEALTLGSATRKSPLTLVISTAGYDLESPLGRLYSYGLRVDGHQLNGVPQKGEEKDPTFGMCWYGPEPGQDVDPADESLWSVFNPAFSSFMNVDEFRSALQTTHESAFIRYRLNGWTSAESAWLPHGAWDALVDPDNHLEHGDEVVLGFDGAWKGDSTGLVAVRLSDMRVEVLAAWEAPPGVKDWRTPQNEVEEALRDACDYFTVRELAADPWRWEQTLEALAAEGLPVLEFNTGSLANMIPATQNAYDLIRDGALTHDGDPRLARHIANCVLKEDRRGARVTKDHPTSNKKIDLAVAMVIALHRAKHWNEQEPASPEPSMFLL